MSDEAAQAHPDVGLCAHCAHASVQRSAKGNEFWRCRAADEDPQLLRYPPLPVIRCLSYLRVPGSQWSGSGSPTATKKDSTKL